MVINHFDRWLIDGFVLANGWSMDDSLTALSRRTGQQPFSSLDAADGQHQGARCVGNLRGVRGTERSPTDYS